MNNDERILKLKQSIKLKKAEVNKIARFTPNTNCSLAIDGSRFNLHTLNKQDLTGLLVKLNLHYISARDLDLLEEYKISGYCVEDWISDVKSKLDILEIKEKRKDLDKMETKLTSLLSNKKQTELEIDEIEEMLK